MRGNFEQDLAMLHLNAASKSGGDTGDTRTKEGRSAGDKLTASILFGLVCFSITHLRSEDE